jgi:hypothetical protein
MIEFTEIEAELPAAQRRDALYTTDLPQLSATAAILSLRRRRGCGVVLPCHRPFQTVRAGPNTYAFDRDGEAHRFRESRDRWLFNEIN